MEDLTSNRMASPFGSSGSPSSSRPVASPESGKLMTARSTAVNLRKMVASASSAAPVSLNTKTSIPTGRTTAPRLSGPSSSIGRSPSSLARAAPGAKSRTNLDDLKNRQFTDFSVRVPKASKKEHSLMRFNGAHKVDFSQWTSVKLHREDNSAQFKLPTFGNREAMPKFGAGSEYGREEREEARRMKYGMNRRKYKAEDQPWVLKVGDKINRRFKGLKEGGVSENASYFVFTQAKDGHFDVYPVKNWYNFTPVQKYKALSAEEAEEEFSRRNKVMNLFSVMVRKRMKIDEQEEGDNKKNEVNRAFKMSEMDDWAEDDEDGSADSGDEDKEAKDSKKKAVKKNTKKKKKDSDDEPLEDSDDGDDEGRELDYISDSSEPSEDEEEKKPDLPGVSEEGGQHGSSSSSEEEEEKQKEKADESEDGKGEGEKKKKSKKKKKASKKEEIKTENPDIEKEEPEDDVDKSDFYPQEGESAVKEETPTLKRKASEILLAPAKKTKVEVSSSLLTLAASEGITEDAVRKYLLRKPMTVAELLQKFKPKKTKIPNEDMVPIIAHILKKINPTKRTQNSKMYFFLKT